MENKIEEHVMRRIAEAFVGDLESTVEEIAEACKGIGYRVNATVKIADTEDNRAILAVVITPGSYE